EGLETTLFIWTAVKASASTVAPLIGAGIGLAAAVVVCWLLYRRAVRLNLGKFFQWTALALIVIAAGVLAYGLRDLQEAGWLPGQQWIAFDLSAHVDPNSWWMSIITGVTQLSPKMTVLQVVAWAGYLAVVIPAFLAAGRAPAAEPATTAEAQPGRWAHLVARRPWLAASALVLTPVLVAGLVIAALPASGHGATTAVSVTSSSCGTGWTAGHTGPQSFFVTNRSSKAGEITLVNESGAIVAEVETLGPATTAAMSASLAPGQYRFACLLGATTRAGPPVQVTGPRQPGTVAVKRVSLADLAGPNRAYQAYAAGTLAGLARDVGTLRAALAAGALAAARRDWQAAQLDWERVGASYNSFGAAGQAVDGLPDGLPGGAADPGFAGLHRIEYGLYHGQSAAQLRPVAARLARAVATVRSRLTSTDEAGDPVTLTLRVHEILEDALRDHLSGLDDQGSGLAYPATYADTLVTRTVLGEVSGLLGTRRPGLVPRINQQLDTLQTALLDTRAGRRWRTLDSVPLAARQRVDAALGAVLESLSDEPTLLEVPPTS
ncbi:MAG TPA: FTR1 family protein, partial [Streptosporangiaceae bacterium]